MFAAKAYINHLVKSGNQHSIHSPFVFELYNKVIKGSGGRFPEIEAIRKSLKSNKTTIPFTEMGAGSRRPSKSITIGHIAKTSLQEPKFTRLIARLTENFQPKSILELGTSLGLTAAYMANVAPNSSITTLEGNKSVVEVAKGVWQQLGVSNINPIIGDFETSLPDFLSSHESLDLIYMDGNHQKEPTLSYFNQCVEKCHEDSLIILDDIYWSKGMNEAWNNIINDKRVTVSIDLFKIGLIFFREGQAKQNFKLRF